VLGAVSVLSSGTSASAAAAQRSPELWIVDQGDASALAVRRLGGVEMVRLAEVAAALGGTVRPGEGDRQAVLRFPGETIRFDAGRSFVQVGETTRVLRNPSVRRGGEWFVPLDFVALVLPDILPGRTRYDDNARTLAVGEGYPRLEVEIASRPGSTRVILRTDPSVPLDIEEGRRRVSILVQTPFVETAFVEETPRDGVVEHVDLIRRGTGYILEINTGRNYGRFLQERAPGVLTLNLLRGGVRAASGADVLADRADPEPRGRRDSLAPAQIRTIAIDPGHGGPNRGASGRGGVIEKDVALAVARALGELLEREHGFRVVLTRDADRDVALDDRVAAANTGRADVLISIHLNASPSAAASGSLVYHLTPVASSRTSAGAAVQFVPWNSAQAPFVPASRRLAEAVAAELEALDIAAGGVADAPVRILRGAAMAAVQVELGFVTSQPDLARLSDPAFPDRAARALAAGILRYQRSLTDVRPTGDIR
jgi:N-acetylmuramoyl-L-alanine amidase